MPGFDGTGPRGLGPMTGRGLGPCGPGPGWGRGRGFGRSFAGPWCCYPFCPPTSKQDQAETLKNYKQTLEQELKAVNQEIAETKK